MNGAGSTAAVNSGSVPAAMSENDDELPDGCGFCDGVAAGTSSAIGEDCARSLGPKIIRIMIRAIVFPSEHKSFFRSIHL
jgi:hypothetical protein